MFLSNGSKWKEPFFADRLINRTKGGTGPSVRASPAEGLFTSVGRTIRAAYKPCWRPVGSPETFSNPETLCPLALSQATCGRAAGVAKVRLAAFSVNFFIVTTRGQFRRSCLVSNQTGTRTSNTLSEMRIRSDPSPTR